MHKINKYFPKGITISNTELKARWQALDNAIYQHVIQQIKVKIAW